MKSFDLQVNGAFGVDYSSPEMTADDFCRATEKILETGCTRFLPTVITSSMGLYRRNLPMINKEIRRHGWEYELPGFHLEGPFISPEPGAVGAHNPAYTMPATMEAFDELYDCAEGRISILTAAAELPGCDKLIERAHAKGIKVSLGHQMANEEQILAAGADTMTHLGNGLPNLIDRHHNPIWTGLGNDDMTIMAITDGHHLPAHVVKCFIRAKGVDRFIAVSDASQVSGLPPGKYNVFGNETILEENGRFHIPAKNCLCGSSYLMNRCIEFLRREKLLTEEEIETVCWVNPHKLLGLPLD